MFAEVDPYRAATHNKGFMNGVDAFLIAMGQDTKRRRGGCPCLCCRSEPICPRQWRNEETTWWVPPCPCR